MKAGVVLNYVIVAGLATLVTFWVVIWLINCGVLQPNKYAYTPQLPHFNNGTAGKAVLPP